MPRERGAERTADASAAATRAAEVNLNISRHLALVDVAVVEFSSSGGSSSSSNSSSSADSDSSDDSLDKNIEVDTTTPNDVICVEKDDPAPAAAPAAKNQSVAPAPPLAAEISSGGSSNGSGGGDEFFAEPEWQRAPGRWAKFEDDLLKEMKAELHDDLRAAPPFPEVIGSRRMLRFLRGHKHDAKKAALMMRQMLQWRKDNGVDAIREDIVQNQKFDPRRFPEGEMITRLFPLLVANPLCVDMDGAPISYESYEFSPRQVTAHANGDLGFFIKFHIYCQEFKQICLDSLSDAKEMENLTRMAADRASSPSPSPSPSPRPGTGRFKAEPASNGGGGGGGNGGQPPGSAGADRGTHRQGGSEGGRRERNGGDGAGGHKAGDGNSSINVTSGDSSLSSEEHKGQRHPSTENHEGGGGRGRGGGVVSGGGDVKEKQGEGGEPWGVVLRNTIIRDLSGFGMEHAGPIGRSLISQVLAVSQDNYPEMMETCYVINAPWVFYALWKGLTPLVSANTAKKVQVLKYDFLPKLCETISLERLPWSAGGGCDPTQVTLEQMHDFVVCGRVAPVPGAGGGGGGGSGGVGGGGSTDEEEESKARTPSVKQEEFGDDNLPSEELETVEGVGGSLGATDDDGGGGSGASRGGSLRSSVSSGGGGGDDDDDAAAAAARRGGSKPHVTFRSLFERLQARDEPRDALAAAAIGAPPPRSAARPLAAAVSRDGSRERGPFLSPPLSRQGSIAGGGGGGRSGHSGGRPRPDSRSSPRRGLSSPEPRGARRAASPAVGVLGGGTIDGSVSRVEPAAAAAAAESGDRSPRHGDQAEDFDSRLVGRALKLSMKRKAQRFKKSEAVCGDEEAYGDVEGSGSGDGDGDGDGGTSPPRRERSPDEGDRREKGGWAKKKWRALRERREGRKMLEKGFLADLPGLSAGDCAEWIPNSARSSCLHCERPFTLILRRHHCRMCGELVCGHCSPHRVRLTEDGKEAVVGPASGSGSGDGDGDGSGGDGGGGGGGGGGPRRSSSFSRRRDSGGGGGGSSGSRLSNGRKESSNGGQRPVAVRVCTDCHFSLQTVTVASESSSASSALQLSGTGATGGGGRNAGSDGVDDGDGGANGCGDGETNGDGGSLLLRGIEGDPDLGVGVGGSGSGSGRGFVERLEAVYLTEEISGDVVLEDVLQWGRIQRRASKSVGVVRMCLVVVVEMHHNKLLEMALRLWRASSGVISSAVKHAAATWTARSPPPPSAPAPAPSRPRSARHSSSGGDGGGGESAVVPATLSTSARSAPMTTTTTGSDAAATSETSAQPPVGSPNNNSNSGGGGGGGGGGPRGTSASAPRAGSSPLSSTPEVPATGTIPAAAAAVAAADPTGEGHARSSEVLVTGVETALWATLDRAASYYSSTWVLFVAVLPFIFWLL